MSARRVPWALQALAGLAWMIALLVVARHQDGPLFVILAIASLPGFVAIDEAFARKRSE